MSHQPSSNLQTDALLIFVKNPVSGKVKTRLARTLGEAQALQVYQRLLQHTLRVTQPLSCPKIVFYSDQVDPNDFWAQAGYQQCLQTGGDLGERMQAAFALAFSANHPRAVIIGSDCWELTTGLLEEAFRQLQTHDAVVGPAHDGGYYLLGLRQPAPTLFAGKEWSTARVLSNTLADLQRLQLRYFMLPVLSDVDEAADLPPELLPGSDVG